MGQIPSGPILASKEEGELTQYTYMNMYTCYCDTPYLEIDIMVQIVLFLQLYSVWMPFFLYHIVEVLSHIKVHFPKHEIKTNAIRLRDKLWNLSIIVLKWLTVSK